MMKSLNIDAFIWKKQEQLLIFQGGYEFGFYQSHIEVVGKENTVRFDILPDIGHHAGGYVDYCFSKLIKGDRAWNLDPVFNIRLRIPWYKPSALPGGGNFYMAYNFGSPL